MRPKDEGQVWPCSEDPLFEDDDVRTTPGQHPPAHGVTYRREQPRSSGGTVGSDLVAEHHDVNVLSGLQNEKAGSDDGFRIFSQSDLVLQ